MEPHEYEARESRLERYERAAESRSRFEPLFYEVNDATRSTKDEGEAQGTDGAGPLADGERPEVCDSGPCKGSSEWPRFAAALDGILEHYAKRGVSAG